MDGSVPTPKWSEPAEKLVTAETQEAETNRRQHMIILANVSL